MKLNLKQKFYNLKNEEVKYENESLTLGIVLATLVLQPHKQKKGFRPLKAWELAKRFYDNDACEIDKADFVQIKDLLEEQEVFFPFVIAQVEEMLLEAEKDKKDN